MAGKKHPSDWSNAAPLTKRLALLALLGVVGGVALTMHFSAAAADVVGPTLIARNAAGDTLLANGDTVFLVDAGEANTQSIPLEAFGLRGPVLSAASDGTHWYLGDDATGMLYRCDLRARKCTAALQARDGDRIFRRAHRVAFAADRIFVTDSEAHRVLTFNRDGSASGATRTSPLALCFPNGIVAVDDQLYVADTNNFRIARLASAAPEQSATLLHTNVGAPVARANCNPRSADFAKRGSPVLNLAIDSANTVKRNARPPARPDRVWPASVLHTRTGEWWVVQMDNHMKMGDVIRYGADGRPLGRLYLPTDADPIELIEGHNEVLITDAGLTRVHRVSLQGALSGEWGPPDFHKLLRAIDAERGYARNLQYLSMTVIAIGIFAALLVVVFELRRQRAENWSTHGTLRPVAVPATALGHEPAWLSIDAEVLRRVRRVVWLLGAYTIICLGILLYLASDLRLDTPVGRLRAFVTGAMVSLVLLAGVIAAINTSRLPRRRIGVSRDEVWYEPGSGNVVRCPREYVRVGSHAILVGRTLVQIVDLKGRHLYPQPEVESRLLSHLPPTAFLGNWRFQLEALRRGNVALWITVVATALYLGFVLLRWLQPSLMRGLGAQIVDLFR